MAETDVLTYLQTPPRRPALDDLGGGLYENDAEGPLAGDPDALAFNQSDKLLVAAHAVLDFCRLWVAFDGGGVPSIQGVACLRTGINAGSFTVTDNGNGDTSITHTGGLFPMELWPAAVDINGNAGDTTGNAEKIANGWRVRTRTGGTLANVPFTLRVSGL